MMKMGIYLSMAAALPFFCASALCAGDVIRVRYPREQGRNNIAKVVSVGKLAFPSGAAGASEDPLMSRKARIR